MLHLHRAERADRLVEALAEVLRVPPADPFAVEVVSVPAKGVERWLAQRLAHVLGAGAGAGAGDGVCANVAFPPPWRMVDAVLGAAAGLDPEQDPWRPDRLVWPVLESVDASLGEPWCAALAAHLGAGDDRDDGRRGRRLATAMHLAGLFDSYAAHRPAMLRDWRSGADTDGVGAELPADLRWQAELWRRVRTRVAVPSRAERLPSACRALRERPELVDLPHRLSLFGPTRLTAAQLDVLAALAAGREVHLWLPHPSAALWEAIARTGPPASPRRREAAAASRPRNPLLATLGRDARELQLALAGLAVTAADRHHPAPPRPATLLGRLQTGLAGDVAEEVPPHRRPVLAEDDHSLQVRACHGAARQVEVLREVLVGLLADDPTLEPRDVLVMCPDIEAYAPLVSATFGLADGETDRGHPGHRLRVRLADRSLRQTNPLLGTMARLLELASARVTASELLDFAAAAPVRRRFRFAEEELERLADWVSATGVRWGLDAAHRAPYALAHVRQNTWRAGLDRLLLGTAMAEDELHWVGLALPLDDVDSGDVDLAGRFAELVDRLGGVLDEMVGERPLADWLATLTRALDSLTAVREADGWQAAQARRELGAVAAEAGERATSVPLGLPDLQALLADRLAGRPTRANFRTGNLTMCSMVPMRSVPHRVVCLLGLDDGAFPRGSAVDGDDVLARDPCVGERDRRSEDRQLLLDALLAAGERLVILYTGADPRTNAPQPPAVPVGEILDAAEALVRSPDERPVREHLLVHHPLQPFDPRNFIPGRLGTRGPFSFDRTALRAAERARAPRTPPGPFIDAPLPPPRLGEVALADLVAFLEAPVQAFLRRRLEVALPRDVAEPADDIAVDLDALQRWEVGNRLLRGRLDGHDAARCVDAEWRRGSLPPGRLGQRLVTALSAEVEPLVAAGLAAREDRGCEPHDVVVDLDGRRVSGTVPAYGRCVVRVEYSRLAPKHRLRAWAQLLVLAAARPEVGWTAVTIGRDRKNGQPCATSRLGPVDGVAARHRLSQLLDLYALGLSAPLPMAAKTSHAYARAGGSANLEQARRRAEQEWTARRPSGQGGDDHRVPGENEEPAHALVWGDEAALDVLLADPSEQGPPGSDWPADESSRFGALARWLWDPLLAAETGAGR